MNNEEMLKRVGTALIAAGYALAGTPKKVEVKAETEEAAQPEQEKVEAKTETEAPKKKKRKRRTKAEIEAEKKAKAEAEDDFEGEDISEAEVVQEVALDQDKLKSAIVSYAKKHSKDMAFAILKKYGAKKVADLDPKHYQDVYEQVAVNA